MLLNTLNKDLLLAMKARNTPKVSVIRYLLSLIKNKEIEFRTSKRIITDEVVLDILDKEKKKRLEAIEMYKNGNRQDLAESEKNEVDIISAYLPKEISNEELEKEIENILSTIDQENRNFNFAIKIVIPRLKGKADGKRISMILRNRLQIYAVGSRCATPICRGGCQPKADPTSCGNLQGAPPI